MSGWGNGIARPWHERPQPTVLARGLGELGWTTSVAEQSVAPRGRTLLNTVEIHSADGALRGRAWFRDGSFVGGVIDNVHHRAVPLRGRMDSTGIRRRRTPHDGVVGFVAYARKIAEGGAQ